MGTLMVVGLRFVLVRFLDNAMSFDGWAAQVYAAWLALALTLWGFFSRLAAAGTARKDISQIAFPPGVDLDRDRGT